MTTMAIPSFWLDLLLMLLFGLTLGWFPISGWGEGFFDHIYTLFLPALAIGLYLAPILIQSLRVSLLDIMQADYVEVARAKGLSANRVMWKHVLRNALIPTVTILAVNIGWLIGEQSSSSQSFYTRNWPVAHPVRAQSRLSTIRDSRSSSACW
jgi:peptide/nickel transport system permease protein